MNLLLKQSDSLSWDISTDHLNWIVNRVTTKDNEEGEKKVSKYLIGYYTTFISALKAIPFRNFRDILNKNEDFKELYGLLAEQSKFLKQLAISLPPDIERVKEENVGLKYKLDMMQVRIKALENKYKKLEKECGEQ